MIALCKIKFVKKDKTNVASEKAFLWEEALPQLGDEVEVMRLYRKRKEQFIVNLYQCQRSSTGTKFS